MTRDDEFVKTLLDSLEGRRLPAVSAIEHPGYVEGWTDAMDVAVDLVMFLADVHGASVGDPR